MGTKVVIDTNVLVSAFGWQGKPRKVFEKVLDGKLELVISEKQLTEIRRVILYPRLKFTPEQQTRFLDILSRVAHIVETHSEIHIIQEDPTDNVLLESATENKAEYIITGDNHLLKLKQFQEVQIVTPAEFLEGSEPHK